jgi:predicted ribonuclease YlaK
MSRLPRKPALTSSNPQLDRQARRINRQQKQLDRQMLIDMGQESPRLTGATGRAIKLSNLKKLSTLTDTQHDFFDAWEDGEEAMLLYGSAGTGKTFICVYHALQEILQPESQYKKILIIRSSVSSRDIGHLPGTAEEKLEQFELPYHSIFADLLGRSDAYEKLKDIGKVEFLSSSFLRGSTFNDTIIIVDEVQSMNWHEISTILTRVGKNTKLIICGDGKQDDLQYKKNDTSGFKDFLTVTKNMSEFRHFRFTTDDIVRSAFVKSFLIQCEKLGL